MSGATNVIKGRDKILLVRNDLDTLWNVVGGVTTTEDGVNNAGVDVTSSSTTGDFTEKQFNGYSDATISLSGVYDTRVGATEPNTGFTIVGSERIQDLAYTGERCGQFKMVNVTTGGEVEGIYLIANYSESSEIKGVVNFSFSLESQSDVVRT